MYVAQQFAPILQRSIAESRSLRGVLSSLSDYGPGLGAEKDRFAADQTTH
jgi:hypothetical protein